MRIRILTQYYPPETGAPQNRLHSLALNLRSMGAEVDILTAMPSYPKSEVFEAYRGRLFMKDVIDGIDVKRSWIFVTKSKGVLLRLLNYFSFVFTAFCVGIFQKRSDYLICESPPLFLGITAYLISRLRGSKLVFNVSDLWPESAEKLDIVTNKTFLNLAYRLEAFLYRKSALVTGQTMGIVKSIRDRFPDVDCIWVPNGIDKHLYSIADETVSTEWQREYGIEGKHIFIYAGIIGHAQGLDIILHARAEMIKKSPDKVADSAFVIVGDGPEKEKLLKLQQELKTDIVFIPNTPKAEVLRMIASCYSYIVPLLDLELFRGAIPSKIFDPLAFGIPILLAVDGEARQHFIDRAKAGYFVIPEDSMSLLKAVEQILDHPDERHSMGEAGKKYVEEHFDRAQIARQLLDKLNQIQ